MMTNKMKETVADYLPDGYLVVEDKSPVWRLLTFFWATVGRPSVGGRKLPGKRDWVPYTERLQDGRTVDLGRMSTLGLGWNVYRFNVYHRGNPNLPRVSEGTQIFIVDPKTHRYLEWTAAETIDSVMEKEAEKWFGSKYVIITEKSRAWPAMIGLWEKEPTPTDFREYPAPSSDLEPDEDPSENDPRLVHVGTMEMRHFGHLFLAFSTRLGRFVFRKQFKPVAFAVHKSTALVMAEASDWGAFDKK